MILPLGNSPVLLNHRQVLNSDPEPLDRRVNRVQADRLTHSILEGQKQGASEAERQEIEARQQALKGRINETTRGAAPSQIDVGEEDNYGNSIPKKSPCWAITAALKSLFPGVMGKDEEYTEAVIRPQIRKYVDRCLSPSLSGALEGRGFFDNFLKAVGKMASFIPFNASEDAPYSEVLSGPMEVWRGLYYASYHLAPVRWLAGTPIVRDQLARDIFALWSAGKEASEDANFLPSDLNIMLQQYEARHGDDPRYKINRARLFQAMQRAQSLNLEVSRNLRSSHSE